MAHVNRVMIRAAAGAATAQEECPQRPLERCEPGRCLEAVEHAVVGRAPVRDDESAAHVVVAAVESEGRDRPRRGEVVPGQARTRRKTSTKWQAPAPRTNVCQTSW